MQLDTMSPPANPFEELERLSKRMNYLFDGSSRMWEFDEPFGRWTSGLEGVSVDLVAEEDEFIVTADLPGFTREDVNVRVTDSTLQIQAEQEEKIDEEEQDYIRHERRHESVQRSIRLPGEVDADAVHASMKNGVLTINLPKVEVEEARAIEIE